VALYSQFSAKVTAIRQQSGRIPLSANAAATVTVHISSKPQEPEMNTRQRNVHDILKNEDAQASLTLSQKQFKIKSPQASSHICVKKLILLLQFPDRLRRCPPSGSQFPGSKF
jgi:hypothetical protein